MKAIRYALKICPPDGSPKPWDYFESSTPFHAMRPGDTLLPADWWKLDDPVVEARVTAVLADIDGGSNASVGCSNRKVQRWANRLQAHRNLFDVPRVVCGLCNLGRKGAHHAHCAQHVEGVGVAQDGSQWSEVMESDIALIG